MLSIIIPTREEEKIIGATVSRLKRELTMPNEIIVSDGRSKDSTVEIARKYAGKVIVFAGSKHNGAIGRNDGAKVATGEFFVFVDADVAIPNPDAFFKHALAEFYKNPKLVGLTCPQRAFPEVENWADRISFGIMNYTLQLQNNILHRGEASGKFIMVRREAFEKINGFREDLVTREDGDFFLRLSKIGRTYFDTSLMIFHGARRAHKIGWARLWYIWIKNTVHVMFFDKSHDDDWTPMR